MTSGCITDPYNVFRLSRRLRHYSLITVMYGWRTRDRSHKLHQKRFKGESRRNFFLP